MYSVRGYRPAKMIFNCNILRKTDANNDNKSLLSFSLKTVIKTWGLASDLPWFIAPALALIH